MEVKKEDFGKIEGQTIELFTLTNDNGMEVKVMTYGATTTSISVPSKNGRKELVCGFDTLKGYFSDEYKTNAPYFGCIVGRYASRIKDGKFTLEGKDYSLAINDGSNHLHGGLIGFNKAIWNGESIDSDHEVGVKMTMLSQDGDEGYPGNLKVSVTFLLNNDNQIMMNYAATTDAATPLSLTNHNYFNLSGFENTIDSTVAQIHANKYLAPDETNVPDGKIADVAGEFSDLSKPKLLGEALSNSETGFEHFYIFDKDSSLSEVASFKDDATGISLKVSTTEPGVLFYTGYFTSDKLARESGEQYGKYRGFCFETSRYPNGPNLPDSPKSITYPNKAYEGQTIYQLGW